MWLRKEFAGEEHPVQSGRLAIKHHIAAFFVRNATKAPEEIKMPEGTIELAIGDDMIAQLLLLVGQFANQLVARAG